ncbi:hypothetical protein ONE63_006366 [Megalurothrips usitatus]|uniref:Outer dense fiber protein 3-like n=1 Tax=Megalurothrips usitatus TaxID=439358 RepID=A0AAV7XT47_9NEOP|nr:hypothetical protein ONE63_006366 [Megalurothrips usitatus]
MGGLKQRPWTPTKRRGPIAAEHQSPGPACVSLPTLIGTVAPDSKRERAPAFSFGSRHGAKNDSPGPGPGQYNVTGLSAKGKDSPPSATLHSRPKDCNPDATPAPGDYNPDLHDTSPKYTFGLKVQHDKPSSTPAPNTYLAEKPASTQEFSFGARTQLDKPSDTPAPFLSPFAPPRSQPAGVCAPKQ